MIAGVGIRIKHSLTLLFHLLAACISESGTPAMAAVVAVLIRNEWPSAFGILPQLRNRHMDSVSSCVVGGLRLASTNSGCCRDCGGCFSVRYVISPNSTNGVFKSLYDRCCHA